MSVINYCNGVNEPCILTAANSEQSYRLAVLAILQQLTLVSTGGTGTALDNIQTKLNTITPFVPNAAAAKVVAVSAVSQTVDIVATDPQVRIINTSTSAVSVKMSLSTSGAITAAFTNGNGTQLAAGASEVFTRPAMADRFAVIGLVANGTVQITPGTGF